ncbi:MAG: hypothetical protein QHJ34_15245 [bacterium]|jgi:uncharacterized protein YlxW (UPF0749 family)|nr:hypothetical protein [candidate division KSB1 bacterium]MDH7561558.1 hypothetical protein [bacterium]
MDAYTMALLIVGALILGGVLWQLRVSVKAGVVFVLAALAAVLGFSVFAEARRRRLLKQLQAREAELAGLERRLAELQKQYALSAQEVREAQEAMRKERVAYMRRILMLEAEKEKRVEAIERMSPEEVLEAFGRAFGNRR